MKIFRQARNRIRPGGRGPRIFLPAMFLLLFSPACEDSTAPVATLWEGTLSPVPPSQVSGVTAAVTQFGRTEVSIEIRLAEPDLVYTWQVETGGCQSEGQIQGGPALYTPLSPGEAGMASAIAVLPNLFESGSQLSVKVFSPEGASQRLASCGKLNER